MDRQSFFALRELDGFKHLTRPERRRVAVAGEVAEYEPGDVLVRRGDVAEVLYILLAGELEVMDPRGRDVVARLDAPAVIGEITLFAGSRRTATVLVQRKSRIAKIPAEMITQVSRGNPGLLLGLADAARERLRRNQLRDALGRLFGDLDQELLAEFERIVQFRNLSGGELLFAQGTTADALYIVMSGRVGVELIVPGASQKNVLDPAATTPNAAQTHTTRLIAELGPGETVGEMALLSDAPRSAGIRAIRDSDLARIPSADFEWLAERHPVLIRQISRTVVTRLAQQNTAAGPVRQARAFAVIALGDWQQGRTFAEALKEHLTPYGVTMCVDSKAVDHALGQQDIAQVARDEPGKRVN